MTTQKKTDGTDYVEKIVKKGDTLRESLDRQKITDETKKELIKNIEKGDLETYARKTFEILTGETVEEAQK